MSSDADSPDDDAVVHQRRLEEAWGLHLLLPKFRRETVMMVPPADGETSFAADDLILLPTTTTTTTTELPEDDVASSLPAFYRTLLESPECQDARRLFRSRQNIIADQCDRQRAKANRLPGGGTSLACGTGEPEASRDRAPVPLPPATPSLVVEPLCSAAESRVGCRVVPPDCAPVIWNLGSAAVVADEADEEGAQSTRPRRSHRHASASPLFACPSDGCSRTLGSASALQGHQRSHVATVPWCVLPGGTD